MPANFVNDVRLVRDGELRYTDSGKAVLSLTGAYDVVEFGKEKKKHPNFVKITLWEKQAENMVQYMTKGTLLKVSGELALIKETDKAGKDWHSLVLFFPQVGFAPKNAGNQASENGNGHAAPVSNEGGSDDPFATRSEPSFVPELAEGEIPF